MPVFILSHYICTNGYNPKDPFSGTSIAPQLLRLIEDSPDISVDMAGEVVSVGVVCNVVPVELSVTIAAAVVLIELG